MTRAAAIGGVSKSQNKSWRPLRHEGRLGANGLSTDNKMVNYRIGPSELGGSQKRGLRPL